MHVSTSSLLIACFLHTILSGMKCNIYNVVFIGTVVKDQAEADEDASLRERAGLATGKDVEFLCAIVLLLCHWNIDVNMTF